MQWGRRGRLALAAAAGLVLLLCSGLSLGAGYRLGAGARPAPAPTIAAAPPVAPPVGTATAGPAGGVALADVQAQRSQLELVVEGLRAIAAGEPPPAGLTPAVVAKLRAALEARANAANDTYYRATTLYLEPVGWQRLDPLRTGDDPARRATWEGRFRGEVVVREVTAAGTPVAAPLTRRLQPGLHELTVRLAHEGGRWIVVDVAGALVGSF